MEKTKSMIGDSTQERKTLREVYRNTELIASKVQDLEDSVNSIYGFLFDSSNRYFPSEESKSEGNAGEREEKGIIDELIYIQNQTEQSLSILQSNILSISFILGQNK